MLEVLYNLTKKEEKTIGIIVLKGRPKKSFQKETKWENENEKILFLNYIIISWE